MKYLTCRNLKPFQKNFTFCFTETLNTSSCQLQHPSVDDSSNPLTSHFLYLPPALESFILQALLEITPQLCCQQQQPLHELFPSTTSCYRYPNCKCPSAPTVPQALQFNVFTFPTAFCACLPSSAPRPCSVIVSPFLHLHLPFYLFMFSKSDLPYINTFDYLPTIWLAPCTRILLQINTPCVTGVL